MRKTFLWLSPWAVFLAFATQPHAKTIRMEVNGMVCSFCAQGIEKKLRAMKPTQDVLVNLESKLVAVALKDGQDIPDATLVSIIKEAGYDVTGVKRVDEPIEAIRKSMKKK